MLGGDWRFPDEGMQRDGKAKVREEGAIGEAVREVVRKCLRVEAAERPDVDQLIEEVEKVVADLPDDDGDAGGE